jgi:hypothetical protein
MNRARPTLVVVFAVLNIVFGSLSFLFTLCSGVGQVALDRMSRSGLARANILKDMAEASDQLRQEVPGYGIAGPAAVVVLLVLSLTLVVAGIGLLKMKPWSRRITIIWSWALILYEIAWTTYQVTLINPVQLRIQQQMMAKQAKAMPDFLGSTLTAVITVVFALLIIVYAVGLLVVVCLPAIQAAFAGQPLASPGEPPDYNDERITRPGSAND